MSYGENSQESAEEIAPEILAEVRELQAEIDALPARREPNMSAPLSEADAELFVASPCEPAPADATPPQHKKPNARRSTSSLSEAAFLREHRMRTEPRCKLAPARVIVSVSSGTSPSTPASLHTHRFKLKAPAEWSRASDPVQAHFAFEALALSGPVVAFTTWLSDDVAAQAYAQAKPLPWIRERVKLYLNAAFPAGVEFVIAIEEEWDPVTRRFRLHLHGLLQLTHKPRECARARGALRKALGSWEGKAKNRQIRFKASPDAGWASYATKRAWLATPRMRGFLTGLNAGRHWSTSFDGPVLTMTNGVRGIAKSLHADARVEVRTRRALARTTPERASWPTNPLDAI
jgi:hypothetical protein